MKFSDLNFESSIVEAIEKLNFNDCTPIQEKAMPPIIEGKDVAGLAQTGTGKTAAFLLPLMDRVLKSRLNIEQIEESKKELVKSRAFADWKPFHYVLVLVPTRELAEQVLSNVEQLGASSGLRGVAIYGGTSYDKQKEGLKRGVEFVIATPGRLIDLYKEHIVDLKQVRAVVFDEADRMFDMGFKDDMKYVLQRIPKDRQFLVFSATLNFDVLNTAYQFGANPVEVDVSRDQTKAENVKDEIFHVGNDEKPRYLISLLKHHKPKQTIIFSNFKNNIDRVVRFLNDNGVPAVGISSLLTQAQRNRVLEQFKSDSEFNILVATDVAARGLDIKGVDMVINYELPQDAENYVHRIGRTGRAGQEGMAFSFVSDRDVDSLSRIEDYLKHKLNIAWLEDSSLIQDFKPMLSDWEASRASGGSRPARPQRGGERGSRSEHSNRQSDRHGDRRGGRSQQERRPRPPRGEFEGRRSEGRPETHGERPQRPNRQPQANGARPEGRKFDRSKRPLEGSRREVAATKAHPRSPAGSSRRVKSQPQTKVASAKATTLGTKVKGFIKKIFG